MIKKLTPIFLFTLFLAFTITAQHSVELQPAGTYETGVFDDGATEIAAFNHLTNKLFVTNAHENAVSVIDMSDPNNLSLITLINLSAYGAGLNSVAVYNNILAVAVEPENKQENGNIVFFHDDGTYINALEAGALPDMVGFSPDGAYVVSANEGEPSDEYDVDPVGSVTIIEIPADINTISQTNVTTIDFSSFSNVSFTNAPRVFGPGATFAQDMEPEYITFSQVNPDYAYVVCQENNALARINLASKSIEAMDGLGYKDHSLTENAIDASNQDDVINITTWPVYGIYMPDAIDAFAYNGEDYIVTANEGDSRDYDGYSEEERIKDVDLDPDMFPDAESLQENENLGRLNITTSMGDYDNDNDFDSLFCYGARSFSIRKGSDFSLVYDSGDDFEQITASLYPENFNSTNDENGSFDNRSDDKGPEPEGIVTGVISGETYVFIGLERMGGIMVYKITDPYNPEFVQYITTRDFSGDAEAGTAGNLAPEGVIFIPANESPNNKNLLVATYEVSGSVQVFEIEEFITPVELTSFSVEANSASVNLSWVTATENNNRGFNVERSVDNINFESVGFVSGAGTTSEITRYTYSDKIPFAGKYYYRLKQLDYDGSYEYSAVVEADATQPAEYSLSQNYPNPFNPSTKISFSLAERNNVSLRIYDVLGKEVATLVNEVKEAGSYNVDFNATSLTSGIYFCKLEAGSFTSIRKMNLVK